MADPIFDQVMSIAQGQRALQASDQSNALNAARTQQVVRQMQNEDKAMQLMQVMSGIRMQKKDKDEGVTEDDKIPPALQESNRQMKEALQSEQLFLQQAEALQGLSPDMAKNFRASAETFGRQAAMWQTKYLTAKKDLENDLGQQALAYTVAETPEAKQGALNELNRLDPRWHQGRQVNRETGTEKPVPGELTDKAMMVYAAGKAPQSAMLAHADRMAAVALRKADDESKARLRDAEISERNSREARAKEAAAVKGEKEAQAKLDKQRKAQEDYLKSVNPTERQINDEKAYITKNYKLSDADATVMARDVLTKKNENRLKYFDDEDRDDKSEAEAYADAEKKLVDNPRIKGAQLYNPRGKAAEAPEESGVSKAWNAVKGAVSTVATQALGGPADTSKLDATMRAVDAATPALKAKGVDVKIVGNKVTLTGSSPLVKQAQAAIDAGRPPEAVLKMLQDML